MQYYILKEVCEINPSKQIDLSPDDKISFVPMDSVSVRGDIDTSKSISVSSIKTYSVFREGDVLFAKITPCMENGKGCIAHGLLNGYGAGSTEFIVLRPDSRLLMNKWLYYFLSQQNFRQECKQHMTGSAGQKRVPPKYLGSCSIPVPSISEQQRIVARIEELFSQLDDAEATLQKTKAQLDLYRETVLYSAFFQIDTWINLGNMCKRVFDGPFGTNLKTVDYVSAGIRVVRLENIKNGWFDDSKQSYVTEEKYETIKKHTVLPSDLIISTFISDSIKICQLPEYIGFAVNKADCVGITLNDGINPRFVMYYLASKQAYLRISGQVHGATRPRINTKQIKCINVPICSIQLQDRIVEDIESKLSLCDKVHQTIDDSIRTLISLRQSILKKEFGGVLA